MDARHSITSLYRQCLMRNTCVLIYRELAGFWKSLKIFPLLVADCDEWKCLNWHFWWKCSSRLFLVKMLSLTSGSYQPAVSPLIEEGWIGVCEEQWLYGVDLRSLTLFCFAWSEIQSSVQNVGGVTRDLCNELLYSCYNPRLMHWCCAHEDTAGRSGVKCTRLLDGGVDTQHQASQPRSAWVLSCNANCRHLFCVLTGLCV